MIAETYSTQVTLCGNLAFDIPTFGLSSNWSGLVFALRFCRARRSSIPLLFLVAPPAAVMLEFSAKGVNPAGVASTAVAWLVTVV